MLSRIKNFLAAPAASADIIKECEDLSQEICSDCGLYQRPHGIPAFEEGHNEPGRLEAPQLTSLTSKIFVEPNSAFEVGTLFTSLRDAKQAAVELCKCPVVQGNVRQLSYVLSSASVPANQKMPLARHLKKISQQTMVLSFQSDIEKKH
jgi:hypothetical protein